MWLDLKMEQEREEAERQRQKFYLDFLLARFSHPAQPGEDPEFARFRSSFIDSITPQQAKQKKLEWDIPPEVIEEAQRTQQLLEQGGQKGG